MKIFPRCVALALAVALGCGPAGAQTRVDSSGTLVQGVFDVSNATHAPLYCKITVTTTATSLSALLSTSGCTAIPAWATFAFVAPEVSATVAVRYRADGISPTPTVGQPIAGYQAWPLQGAPALASASLVSATGANVTVSLEIRG